MSRDNQPLWMALLRAGVVADEAPPAIALTSPWYVKFLLAASGWIASLLLLGFLALVCKPLVDDSTIAGCIGGAMLLVAFAMLRLSQNAFVEHLALALSLAAQALVSYWIFEHAPEREMLGWLWMLLLQVALVALMPHFIHRVVSTFVAGIALFMLLTNSGCSFAVSGTLMIGVAWCWLNEWRYPAQIRLVQATGYGLVLALIAFHAIGSTGSSLLLHIVSLDAKQWGVPWMGTAIQTVVMLVAVGMIVQRSRHPLSQPPAILALLGTTVICGLSFEVHGLNAGIMLVLLGFAGANRVLLGLGITALLALLSAYYYLLEQTLLAKSISLCVVGLALLLLRWCMLHFLAPQREVSHV